MPDPGDPAPIHKQIAADLRGQIKAGTLRPGDRLPAIRVLAEQRYSVAPETISKALRDLRDEGLVSAGSTRGTFVLKAPGESDAEVLRRLASTVEDAVERLGKVEIRLAAAENTLRGGRR